VSRLIRLDPRDNVAVALTDLRAGETVSVSGRHLILPGDIGAGHKAALDEIPPGGVVVKYGYPIGAARQRIRPGAWVHTHNLESRLGGRREYSYNPAPPASLPQGECMTFGGFRRPDGQVGTRNDIWEIPSKGCVNLFEENPEALLVLPVYCLHFSR